MGGGGGEKDGEGAASVLMCIGCYSGGRGGESPTRPLHRHIQLITIPVQFL